MPMPGKVSLQKRLFGGKVSDGWPEEKSRDINKFRVWDDALKIHVHLIGLHHTRMEVVGNE